MKRSNKEDEIKKAMADLKAIQEERENLKKLLEKAQREVDAAALAVKSTNSSNQSDKVNYADKAYWDSRYMAKTNSSADDVLNKPTYEWYLGFPEIYQHLKKDAIANNIPPSSSILVPGCGNSTLCEDFYKAGHKNVSGMDYSEVVIESMKKRAMEQKFTSVKYFQADARKMSTEGSNTYSIIVDKGTLDAIATGGDTTKINANKPEVELESAAEYMTEMWRVLCTDGLFVIVTTMPPDVLQPIAIEPLNRGSSKVASVNWGTGHTAVKLTTPEGGDIYYYCLKKLADVIPVTKNKKGSTSSTVKPPHSEDVMNGIMALLEEAKLAKEQVDKAMQKQSAAAAEFNEVNQKRSELAGRLNKDLDRGSETEEFNIASQLMKGENDSEDVEAMNKVKVDALKSMPYVRIVLNESSELVSQGHVDVSYVLKGVNESCWDEDDSLCIVCSGGENKASMMYKATDQQQYECFEYTVKPVKVAAFDTTTLQAFQPLPQCERGESYYCGHLRVPLPIYGGSFHVTYVRTISHNVNTTDKKTGAAIVEYKRVPIIICKSPIFNVKSRIFNAPPEGYVKDHKHKPAKVTSVRRRGASDMKKADGSFTLCVEDMQHINTLSIAFISSFSSESFENARLMTWVYPSNEVTPTTEVVIEVDIAMSIDNVKTVYGRVALSDEHLKFANLNLSNGWSEVDDSGRIICRLPYEIKAASKNNDSKSINAELVGIACNFCSNPLVKEGTLKEIKDMATGVFDNMMHDFICCEAMPTQALTTGDVLTPQHCLYVGSTFLSVNTIDSITSSYIIECKAYNTILDIVTATGGMVASAPLFSKKDNLQLVEKRNRIVRVFNGFINTDCCAIRCSRCLSYVGEGQLNKDECDPENCEHPTRTIKPNPSETLTVSDVNDIRFARHCVCVSELNFGACKAEAAVTRTILHFNAVYNVSTFCLFINQRPNEDLLKLHGQQWLYDRVIVVKLLNKDYKASISNECNLLDCIKISFEVGDMLEVLIGNESRIPLIYEEFNEVFNLLQSRCQLFGKSPFKNQSLSIMYK